MTNREKLIEMSRQLRYCAVDDDCINCERWEYDCGSRKCVDDLLLKAAELLESVANGVTVQQWIPVVERLPEMFVPALVKYLNYNDGTASPTNVDTAVLLEGNVWYWWEGDLADCDDEVKCTVTHWMPLPQPPKGD